MTKKRARALPTIHRFPEVDSTQDAARALIDAGRAREGHIIVADVQRTGRGRYGREWRSPPGGLYATMILAARPLIAIEIGVAIVRALDVFDLRADLKWPNDIEVEGRKLAGTLIERVGDRLLVGIGVNLKEAPIPTAVSVKEIGATASRAELLLGIWQHLQGGSGSERLLDSYRGRSSTLGRRVRVTKESGRTIEGIAMDIDENGHLLVETEQRTEGIASGTCIHL